MGEGVNSSPILCALIGGDFQSLTPYHTSDTNLDILGIEYPSRLEIGGLDDISFHHGSPTNHILLRLLN